MLTDPNFIQDTPYVLLEGAPGQGKSTITQYVCQLYRRELLGSTREPKQEVSAKSTKSRFPIKVDLRMMAEWISLAIIDGTTLSAEKFLASHLERYSGGFLFSVENVVDLLKKTPGTVVFDGLDEVADLDIRRRIVDLISEMCSRIEGTGTQVIVTTRPPAFAGSPQFSNKQFTKMRLAPLKPADIFDYANKWAVAKGADPGEIIEILKDKLRSQHIAELAKNTMQVTILVTLISKHGQSLPEQRTDLYDRYIEHFLDRESGKSDSVKKYRAELLRLHQFLAWRVSSRAELGDLSDSFTESELKTEIGTFLNAEEISHVRTYDLLEGAVERLVFLVSREEGAYEFEVKPLLEYFTARYLYENAAYSPVGRPSAGTKSDILDALMVNREWLNTLRFFAGCFSKNELPSITDCVESRLETSDGPLATYIRMVAAYLLADRVFAQNPRAQKKLLDMVAIQGSLRRTFGGGRGGQNLRLSFGAGKDLLVKKCYAAIESVATAPLNLGLLDYIMEATRVIVAHESLEERCETMRVIMRGWPSSRHEVAIAVCRRMEVLEMMIGEGEFDVSEIDAGMFFPPQIDVFGDHLNVAIRKAVDYTLNNGGDVRLARSLIARVLHGELGSKWLVVGLLQFIIDPDAFSSLREEFYQRGFRSLEVDFDQMPEFDERVIPELREFSLRDFFARMVAEARTTVAPGITAAPGIFMGQTITTLESTFGCRPAIVGLAAVVAGMLPVIGPSTQSTLFEFMAGSSLEFMRHARAMVRNHRTWSDCRKASAATPDLQRKFLVAAVCWGADRWVINESEEISEMIDALSDREFGNLARVCRQCRARKISQHQIKSFPSVRLAFAISQMTPGRRLSVQLDFLEGRDYDISALGGDVLMGVYLQSLNSVLRRRHRGSLPFFGKLWLAILKMRSVFSKDPRSLWDFSDRGIGSLIEWGERGGSRRMLAQDFLGVEVAEISDDSLPAELLSMFAEIAYGVRPPPRVIERAKLDQWPIAVFVDLEK